MNIHDRPILDDVACFTNKTFRVRCSDVAFAYVVFQTTVVGVDDKNDILFVAVDCQVGVFTRSDAQRYSINNFYVG